MDLLKAAQAIQSALTAAEAIQQISFVEKSGDKKIS